MGAERWLWAKLGIGAVVATALGGVGLASQLSVARAFAADESSCKAGSAEACFRLASSNSTGGVVRTDKPSAFRLYAVACELGHAEACRDQALCFELGIGVPKDLAQAKTTYEHACQLGFAKACDERRELDAR